MGNASSLVADEKSEIVQRLKADYEECVQRGKSDKEIQEILTKKYNALLEMQSKRGRPGKSGKLTRRASQVGGVSRGRGTRRRSFGEENSPRKGVDQNKNTQLAESASVPTGLILEGAGETPEGVSNAGDDNQKMSVTPLTAPKMDSWDSVVEQPRCDICNMVFQNEAKLTRHVKYSSVHANSLKKLEAAKSEANDKVPELNPVKQVEGVDYRLIYSGAKMFWRSQTDLEFHLYMHNLAHTIEVIPYDAQKSKELSRIYLEVYALENFIKEDALNTVRSKIKSSTKGGKYSKPAISKGDQDVMVEEEKRVLLGTHIMSRMQLNDGGVTYVPLSGDEAVTKQPILQEGPPAILVPVPVVRRRRTTTEDIANKLQDLAMDQQALAAATNKAEKVASLMTASVGSFGAAMKRKQSMALLSKWQAKWRWACHRVVLQNAVENYTKQWLAWEEKQKSKGHVVRRASEAP